MNIMDNKTEVVIFHDLAEVIVDNSKVLVWVGTQTFTIRHLDEEEANEINTKNSTQTNNEEDHAVISSVKETNPLNSGSNVLSIPLGQVQEVQQELAPAPQRVNGYSTETIDLDAVGDTCNSNVTNVNTSNNNNNNIEEVNLVDDDDQEEISASDTVQSLSSTSSNDGTESNFFTRTKPGQPNTSCNVCIQGFTSEYCKKRHQLSHFGIKPHKCNFCGKYFAQSSSYYTHKCSSNTAVSAAITTYVQPTLDIPVKKSNTRMLVCTACGKSFPGIYKLRRHEISHTGEKPYRCDVCMRAFTQWTGMSRHNCPGRVIDPDKVPPSCEDCGKIFKSKKYLEIHRQIHKFDGRSDVNDKDIDQVVMSTDLEIEKKMDTSDFVKDMLC